MKDRDIPKWNPKLNYFEQNLSTLQFWENEKDKFTKGFNLGGVFIHPFLYWHTNIFKARIKRRDGKEPIMCPPLDDNLLYFIENYMEAEKKGLGVCLFGTRGFTKTVLEASFAHWSNTVKQNGKVEIYSGSSKDLEDITKAIRVANDRIHPAFSLPILTEDWDKEVLYGIRETNGFNIMSTLSITNLEKGRESASEKSAGGTPIGWLVDEIGKFDPIPLLTASDAKFKSQYGASFVPFLSGTGGNEELSKGAQEVLMNPSDFNLLPMNYNTLENKIPEEWITWGDTKGKPFCTFVPGQMSYRNPVEKIETNLAEINDKPKDRYLKKVKVMSTDWEGATKSIRESIDEIKNDTARNKKRMYFPLNTDDCFLTDNTNPFGTSRIQKRRREVEKNPKYKKVELTQNMDGTVNVSMSDKKPAPRAYSGKNVEAPILVFEDESENTFKYTNCSGMDDYNLTSAIDSDSLGTIYTLKRRNLDINEPIERIVCSYTARTHNSHNDLYGNVRLILKKYNSLLNLEAIDVGFANYLETNGFKIMDYLIPNINPSKDLSNKKKGKNNSRYGTYPTPGNKSLLLKEVLEYTKEKVVIGFDGNKEPIEKTGLDYIEDPWLLMEMEDYKPKGNFDRIMAFGWALLYCKYLDIRGINPDKKREYNGSPSYIPRVNRQNKQNNKRVITKRFINI